MKWIVVTSKTIDLDEFKETIASFQASIDENCDPIPLGEDEISINVEGPAHLSNDLSAFDNVKIYPNSEIALF